MRNVAADPDGARTVGAQAARDMHAEFSLEAVARHMIHHLIRIDTRNLDHA